jgi:hypothetical protein
MPTETMTATVLMAKRQSIIKANIQSDRIEREMKNIGVMDQVRGKERRSEGAKSCQTPRRPLNGEVTKHKQGLRTSKC